MKNRAAYMVGLNKMEIRETPVPEPKAGEVLVKIEYVGICGSDVHCFKDGRCGDFVVDGELMLGHEAGGVVEKLGEGVTDLKVGDKVTLLGRFQSRAYQKQLPDGTVIGKTAYEVSVGRLTMADAAPQPAPFVIHPEETHTVETLVQPSTPVQVNPFTTPTT